MKKLSYTHEVTLEKVRNMKGISNIMAYPTKAIADLQDGSGYCSLTVTSLKELASLGKPQSLAELTQRIDNYFEFCQARDFRPGIESLALALGVSRKSFWEWSQGNGCSPEWTEKIQVAKQFILAFLEQSTLKGKLNPASSIFYLKNWADYKDSISFEEAAPHDKQKGLITLEELKGQLTLQDMEE